MASTNMKSFFRQSKNTGMSKPKAKGKSSSSSKKAAATFGSDATQPPALISHGSPDIRDDYDQKEELLRQFDMNTAYGPCLGMNRLARWERARSLGMNPPKDVEALLKLGQVQLECLWDGRV